MDNSLLGFVISGVIVLLAVVGLLWFRNNRARLEESDFYQKYGSVLMFVDKFVSETVLRLAFSPEVLTQYEDEARATGRDVRLVAAMHWVDEYSESLGIPLDENHIVTMIEARLAEFKASGIVPRQAAEIDWDDEDWHDDDEEPEDPASEALEFDDTRRGIEPAEGWDADTLNSAYEGHVADRDNGLFNVQDECDCAACTALTTADALDAEGTGEPVEPERTISIITG